MFRNRKLFIATKHEKEKVISPLLEKHLNVQCFVAENFDTDTLGTFTGEVERKGDPITTARNKCLMAMELNNYDLVIASQGSFGSNPSLLLVPGDDKINSCCPKCNTPGFGITDAKKELPFMQCDFPTRSTLSYIYTCQKCFYSKEEMYPNKKITEDPMYCDVCNP